jgi:hypothetical protein
MTVREKLKAESQKLKVLRGWEAKKAHSKKTGILNKIEFRFFNGKLVIICR